MSKWDDYPWREKHWDYLMALTREASKTNVYPPETLLSLTIVGIMKHICERHKIPLEKLAVELGEDWLSILVPHDKE